MLTVSLFVLGILIGAIALAFIIDYFDYYSD